ncbi:MAG: tetratricopeptide repeat protein [Alphaproteobacteria bacterium]
MTTTATLSEIAAAAMACHKAGRLAEAEALYGRILEAFPDHPETLHLSGLVAIGLGRPDLALLRISRAIAAGLDAPDTNNNLGNVLKDLGRFDEAIAAYERAIDHDPTFAMAYSNLGLALQAVGRMTEALARFDQAIALNPGYAEAHYNRATALHDLWRLDEAVAAYRIAIDLKPDFAVAHSNLLVLMPFMPCFDGAAIAAQARRFGEVFEAKYAPRPALRHGNDPDPERRLRIGYLTPCLCDHALILKLGPILHGHRREQVSVHVYAQQPLRDYRTDRLRATVESWTFVESMSDTEVAERIVADGIDILVDPMGHWGENRLPVFAARPAPVQISYLCQSLSTGLSTIDYVISDRWLNGGGALQAYTPGRVVELPGGFEAMEWSDDTPIADPPCLAAGHVTFGSFNNPAKLSDATLRLWHGVLERVPTARMLIKGNVLDRADNRDLLTRRLADHGIAADRVELMGWEDNHLAAFNRIDIVLDTTPYTGGQTTQDALWMGVPVVTLVGDVMFGRLSLGHLSRIGAPELVTHDAAGYVSLAADLAGDPARLVRYRQSLRPAMRASPLMDPTRHVAELEDAFRTMWRRWCAGLPPVAFLSEKMYLPRYPGV